jgi:hypothetical protein
MYASYDSGIGCGGADGASALSNVAVCCGGADGASALSNVAVCGGSTDGAFALSNVAAVPVCMDDAFLFFFFLLNILIRTPYYIYIYYLKL